MKVGDYVQPYMVDDPYAIFPAGLLVSIESKIRRDAGRKRMDENRDYTVYHVLAGGDCKIYEQPFWGLRKIWHDRDNLIV